MTILGMDPVELIATCLGLLAVWYNVKEDVKGWPIGALQVLLYFFIFAEVKLYADAGLQLFFLGMQFYGWYEWLRGGEKRSGVQVSRAPAQALVIAGAVGGISSLLLGFTLKRYTDQALPYWDSAIAAFSLVAQWMLARKYIENWLLWMAIDVVAVGVYYSKGLKPTAVLYVVFFLLCVRGWMLWRRTLEERYGGVREGEEVAGFSAETRRRGEPL